MSRSLDVNILGRDRHVSASAQLIISSALHNVMVLSVSMEIDQIIRVSE